METAELVLDNVLDTVMQRDTKYIAGLTRTKIRTKKRTKQVMQDGGKKTYTMEEVAKHNKKTDAWIVIDGIVADITEWIPKHPGGTIIMKGVGKDASKLFHSIGHDEIAKKMLNKYKIGMLE